MSALLELVNQLAQWISPIFYKLVYLSLTALPVGIIVALVRKIWDKRISPLWKYCMWMVLVLALIIPWRPQSPVSLTGGVQQVEDVGYRQEYITAHQETAVNSQTGTLAPQQVQQHQQQEQQLLVKSIVFDVALPLIWFFGMLVWLAVLLRTQRRFARRVRTATLEQGAFSPLAAQCRQQLNIRRPIPVVVQNYVTSPALTGIVHPRILLPSCAHQMAPDTLRFVLLHELGHYKRRDLWLNQLLLILQCVYWFNPLLYLFFQPIRQDMELMNDSWLLKKLGPEQRAPYSRSLVEVLGLTRRVPLSNRMVMMADGGKNTERRILMMRSHGFFRKHRLMIGLCCLALIGTLCVLFLTSKPTAYSPQKAADALVDSIQAENGTLTFTIPQNGPAAEDWSIFISGRSESPDGMSMSLHFLEGEIWEPGKQYTVDPGEAPLTDLQLYLSLPDGVERDVDLLPYLNEADSSASSDASAAQQDTSKTPVANLSGYTTFMLDDPDQDPGNYAFTGKLSEQEQKSLFHLLNNAAWEEISGPEYCLDEIFLLADDQGHMLHLDYSTANDNQHILATRRDDWEKPLQTWQITVDVASIEAIQRSALARLSGQIPADGSNVPVANLNQYNTCILNDPDQEPGNHAFTRKLTEQEQNALFILLTGTQWEEIPSPEYCLTELFLLTDGQGHTLCLDYAALDDQYHILVTRQENQQPPLQTWRLTVDVSRIEAIQRSVLARSSGQSPSDSAQNLQMPAYLFYTAEYIDAELDRLGILHETVYQKNDRQWQPGFVLDAKLKSGTPLTEGSAIDPGQTVVLYVSDQQSNAGQLGADEHTELDFLTKEQRRLYQQAYDSIAWMIGEPLNLSTCRGNRCGELVKSDSLFPFYLIEGPDRDYQKFRQDMLKIYTPHALDLLYFDERFINHNGQLAVNGGGYGGNVYLSMQPDTYIPVSQTDQEVVFQLVGHYIDIQPGESDDEFMKRREQLDFDWSERTTIRMVNTSEGWRMDEFHSTHF